MTNFPALTTYGYAIEKTLGQNFQGRRFTYLARQIEGDRPVVLKKFAFVQGATDWSGYDSIEAEIKVLQRLNHEQIPDYLGSFTTDDGFYLITEYIDASTLAQTKALSFKEIKAIAIQLLRILQSLQEQQPPIIHRDIKPENILIRRWGKSWRVFLIDFGFARLGMDDLSASSTVKGTLGFMPPEQIFQRELTTASDLYSLGITLISILCGKRSGEIGALVNSDYRIQFRSQLKHLPNAFLDWLEILTEPNLNKRYPDAKAALQALLRLERKSNHVTYDYNNVHFAWQFLVGVLSLMLGLKLWGLFNMLPIPTFAPQDTVTQPTPLNEPNLPSIDLSDKLIADLYQKGLSALNRDGYDEASYYYNQVLEVDPNHFDALSDNCAAYYYLNQPEEALDLCERAIAINDQDYRVYNRHGLVLTGGLDRPAEALLSFERSQQLNPGYFWAWVNHARALTALGKYDQAIASAEKGIEIDQNASGGWYEKSKALRRMGFLELALEASNQGTLVDPSSHLIWGEQGRVLYAQKRYEQALSAFDKAITFNPDHAWHHYRAGLAAEAIGNDYRAIASYEKAFALKPDFTQAQEKLGL
ncbi:serine/threonine-protein kinase [[Leptolyngbya] sp. PCC 7376]|uniref:serine/threonine-protein kinase n=1 Tax=[Leptolyngbya] sp. PCC 7376 TaxID=111781 RepID=UPI00030D357E|nr:serine/threonine-protein kinase [[Leptolyngbya] sp. PCC 7376]